MTAIIERIGEQACPGCDRRPFVVNDTSPPLARQHDIYYLSARCGYCGCRIDAAGIGERQACDDFLRRVASYVANGPRPIRARSTRKNSRGRGRVLPTSATG